MSIKRQLAEDARRGSRPSDRQQTHEQPNDQKMPPIGTKPEAIVHRLSEVKSEQLEWFWPGRIPLGKLTLLAGDPGLGKSFVTCDMAARVSCGAVWPDDSTQRQTAGSVVMFNCEDGLRDTIRPRLERAGADLSKIIAIEGVTAFDPASKETRQRGFSLASDLPRLAEEVAKLVDCRLVVIDPVSAYLGEADSHKNAEVRALLAPLAELAEKHRLAVVMVNHLSKSAGTKAIYRAMGSLGFVAAARAVWHFAKDPDNEQRRLILPAKMNLAPDPTGLAYRIEEGGVRWEADPVLMSADDLVAREAQAQTNAKGTRRTEEVQWLRDLLANGPVPSKQVLADGSEHGFSPKMLRSAFQNIGGKPTKSAMNGPWMWALPASTSTEHDELRRMVETTDWSSVFPPGLPEDAPKIPKMPTS